MLRLQFTSGLPKRLAHHERLPFIADDYPLKLRIQLPSRRKFHIVSLPQQDGSFVASVLQAPQIVVYRKSRKAAEENACSRYLRAPDPHAYRAHPLAKTKAITIDMSFHVGSDSFVTYVKEFERMPTFGGTELEVLDNTVKTIRAYIKSLQASGEEIPLTASKLKALKRLVGIR